jgi:DNA polymerase III delta subunit
VGGTLDQLTRTLGERNLPAALSALASALEAGEEPLRILGFIAYRIRDYARALSGKGWVRDDVRREARNYAAPELSRAVAALFRADRELKGGGAAGTIPLRERRRGHLVLERLLFAIMDSPAPARRPPGHRLAAGNSL